MNEYPTTNGEAGDMTGRQEEEIVDEFPMAVLDGIRRAAGGELTPEAMQRLTADEITLWGYAILREEVMDGGFVQLIHNGYGPFFFFNPFAKAVRLWGIDELARLMKKAGTLFRKYREPLTRECTDEEFMALFEQYPEFDDLDDAFVEQEEDFTRLVARYVEEHPDSFSRHE